MFSHVPPGFRFHPTDEELVDYYLRKKVASRKIDLDVIKDVDLYRIEPWDIQEKCRLGTEEQNEWYFFSHKDKKYPTGTRTNRATKAGFWKATGRDKAIYSKHILVGMRKTLVFYQGRAPNGRKSDWIMHEYRLETDEIGTPQEEGWVVCRVFKKKIAATQRAIEHHSPCWYDEQVSFVQDFDSPKRIVQVDMSYHHPYSCKQELQSHYHVPHDPFHQLPQLESPKLLNSPSKVSYNTIATHDLDINQCSSTIRSSLLAQEGFMQQSHEHQMNLLYNNDTNDNEQAVDQLTNWQVLDKFVASQLSQEDVAKEPDYSNVDNVFHVTDQVELLAQQSDKNDVLEQATTSTSNCQIDLWK